MVLRDKVALVTGAAAGIGEGIARRFAEEGARVFLLDRDTAKNEATAQSVGGQAITVDVTDRKSIEAAVQQAHREFGRIDILINNAGIYPRRRFVDITDADWDQMQDVNLKSVFYAMQAVAPAMIAQRAGKIVNISSVTFFLAPPDLSHYVASKGGVIGLTRSVARELGPHNVHVNCITPGAIHTESEKNFVTEEQVRTMVGNQCLNRRILPRDIADVALFLSSGLSDGMTGQTLNVDGGWAMH